MSDNEQNSFAERLKRIEQKNGNAPAKSGQEADPWKPARSAKRPPMSSTTKALLGCGLVIAVAGTYMFQSLPSSMMQTFSRINVIQDQAMENWRVTSFSLAGDSTGEKTLTEDSDPTEFDRAQGRMGYLFGTNYAATADTQPVSTEAIFAGFAPVTADTPAQQITLFDPNVDCSLRPVSASEKLVNVNIRLGRDTAPLQFANNADVVETLEDALFDALEEGQSLTAYPPNPNHVDVINVMITDTSRPLYLALQSLNQNVLWSLHTAPGVEIAHIAMIAPGSAGFTGHVGDASYELVSANRTEDNNGRPEEIRNPYHWKKAPEDMTCMSRPFREPNETWGAWAGSANGDVIDGNLMYGQGKGFAAYEYWFKQQTGASSLDNLVEAYEASHVLVGRVPEAPLTATSGADVWRFATHDHILTTDPDAAFAALIAPIATAAAKGDVFATVPADTTLLPSDPEVILATVSGELPTLMGRPLVRDPVPEYIELTTLNDRREVTFMERVAFADLFGPGEQMPPEEYRKIYAMMRAPNFVAGQCEAALSDIASRCGLIGASVRAVRAETIQIETTYGYIPNYTMGHYERSSRNTFVRLSLNTWDDENTYESPAAQRAFVARLQSVCDALRETNGNCLISKLRFDDKSSDHVKAHGVLSVYQTDNKYEELKLQQAADSIYAELSTF